MSLTTTEIIRDGNSIILKDASGDITNIISTNATISTSDSSPNVIHISDRTSDRVSNVMKIPVDYTVLTNPVVASRDELLQLLNTSYVNQPVSIDSRSFELQVTMGLVDGYSVVDKFGENPIVDTSTDPEDIWEAGGIYNYDAVGTAPIVSLVSSDPADVNVIEVIGLDINGDQVEQSITLTGTTRVALTTPLWRVYRMTNLSEANLAGICYCYIGTGGVPAIGDTRAIINNGNNQTLMALYTIPRGYIGFLFRGELGMSRSQTTGAARCAYFSRRYEKAFTIKKRVDLTNQGNSIYQDYRSFPDIIPALTDIKLTVEEVTANGIGVFGTFDIMLVEETKFDPAFLTAIGQPS